MFWRLLAFLLFVVLMLWLQSAGSPEHTDLGIVRYPPRAGLAGADRAARTTVHDWRWGRRGDGYRVAYVYGDAAAERLEDAHAALARRFRFTWLDDATFSWVAPSSCRGREWTCIYSATYAESELDLEPLFERMRSPFVAGELSTTEAARWLLAFVQQIPYRLPTEHAFGVVPPALVASRDWGDCDSKSLLLIGLLERLGIDAVLLASEAHAHALVGIDVPTSGGTFEARGRQWAWAETTAENAPLGFLHPRMRLPDDWRIVPIREPF